MYLKKINIENYGPIESLEYDMPNKKNIIFVGKNGSGKSLLLSIIADSIIMTKQKCYDEISETEKGRLFKIQSKNDILREKLFYKNELLFDNNVRYLEVATFISDEYNSKHEDKVDKTGFLKNVYGEDQNIFKDNIFLYFPEFRYDNPCWVGEKSNVNFKKINNYVGYDKESIVVDDIFKGFYEWLLNLVLDSELYKKDSSLINIIMEVNICISNILRAKDTKIKSGRFGISSRKERNIEVICRDFNDKESFYCNIEQLSSGEKMFLALYTSIIRKYDGLNHNFNSLDDIKGIVIIDEIDKNFHIGMQFQYLPEILTAFKNVQFIVSTHSPYFLKGLEKIGSLRNEIINLPDGIIIGAGDFSESKYIEKIHSDDYSKIKELLNKFKGSANSSINIITEGKTDVCYLESALENFKLNNKFIDLNLLFITPEDFNNDKLVVFIKNASIINTSSKIIAIFDRDDSRIESALKIGNSKILNIGHNAYAMYYPFPKHRIGNTNLCSEHLFKDKDLKKEINGKRIYLTSEFNEKNRLKDNVNISYYGHIDIRKYLEEKDSKIIDEKVVDSDLAEKALSKNDFSLSIKSRKENFKDIDFSSFEEIFEIISTIV